MAPPHGKARLGKRFMSGQHLETDSYQGNRFGGAETGSQKRAASAAVKPQPYRTVAPRYPA